MRIAIIGSGISGLLSARLLADEHEVHVFEANEYAGGHTNTVSFEAFGRQYAADTGFMVFNDRTYPNFVQMLQILGVPARNSDMSFSVRCDKTGLEYQGSSLNGLFAQRRNLLRPSFYRMLLDVLRFNRQSLELLRGEDYELELGQYLDRNRYSREFIEHYLIPMGAAIWSAPPERFREFPARFIIDFFNNHGLLTVRGHPQWKTVQGGAVRYVEAITRPFADRIRLNCPVVSVRRYSDRVAVTTKPGGPEDFDAVVLAAHADQSLVMLADPSDAEREILEAFAYQRNETVLHVDSSLLPRCRRAWASWNYRIPQENDQPVVLTYNLNRLQGHTSPDPICVTLNGTHSIDPAKILRQIEYHHPVYSHEALAAQNRFHEINGKNRTYFCGAYWGHGFHEDGVNSALAVGQSFRQTVGIMHSCIYTGYVQHRRLSPTEHVFRYGLYLVYLDLEELPVLLAGGYGLAGARFSPASFRRTDHVDDSQVPLAEAVRNLVEERTGWRPVGPIRLLTLLRNWGYYFCPLCLYYCYDRSGQTVDAVVAEVSNTPWHERHWYVLWQGDRIGEPPQLRFRHPKGFHVSPFMDMDMCYDWHLRTPGAELSVAIVNSRGDERLFDVSLVLKRRELSRWSMLRTFARHPWMTGRVVQAIYWQAFRLWWKKCPYYPHPSHDQGSEAQQP